MQIKNALDIALNKGKLNPLKSVLAKLHPSDIADSLEDLSNADIASIIRLLRFPSTLEFFSHLDLSTQAKVLNFLGRTETVNILEELSPDDRVDLIQELPQQTIDSLMPFIAQAEREEIKKLLQYEEDTAGALMTTEYVFISNDLNIAQALQHIKKEAPEKETIYYIYVVDSHRTLIGIVSLRDLVLGKAETLISDIMSDEPIFIHVHDDQENLVKVFEKYDFLAVPIVDSQQKLVGIVTHDDAFDAAVEEQTEDVHRMGAIEPLENAYLQVSIFEMVKKRGVWLLLLFFGQFFTFSALKYFEATLQQTVSLMFFVPLIISSGGNSGSQSVTLITRALALGNLEKTDFFKVLKRESLIGFALGLFLCFVGIIWGVLVWGTSFNISLAVGISLICVVTFGALVGSLLPIIFERFGFDPAIMSSPFVASIVDVFGIIIYFNVAMLLLNL